MTTTRISTKGVLDNYEDEYMKESYQDVKTSSRKAGDMGLNDGVNPTPSPVFTFEVSIKF